jgi:hypothetical protein
MSINRLGTTPTEPLMSQIVPNGPKNKLMHSISGGGGGELYLGGAEEADGPHAVRRARRIGQRQVRGGRRRRKRSEKGWWRVGVGWLGSRVVGLGTEEPGHRLGHGNWGWTKSER